jgi:hypothetical protein
MSEPKLYIKARTNYNADPPASYKRDADYWEQDVSNNLFYMSGNVGIGYPIPYGKFTIDGTVGIGTNNPQAELDVSGNGYFRGNVGIGTSVVVANLQIGHTTQTNNINNTKFYTYNKQLALLGTYNSKVNTGNSIKLYIGNYDNDVSSNNVYPIMCEDENGQLDFSIKCRPTFSGLPTMFFAGNVGIGTSNPQAQLDVLGNMNINGNIGIGISNPQSQLDVSGTMLCTGGIFTPGYHAQFTLTGGGKVTWNGSSLLWSTRVIALPVQKPFSSVGYIDINCPTSGTITYYNTSNTITTVTCTANGIPIGGWEALWYIVTPGQSSASVQSQFAVVSYINSNWQVSSNWILLAVRNDDDGNVKWIPGNSFLYTWITPTLQNSWVTYDGTFNVPGYYRDTSNRVYLRGMVKNGTAITIFTLPVGYRPAKRELFVAISADALGRLDINIDGTVVRQSGSYSWISLDGISFTAV